MFVMVAKFITGLSDERINSIKTSDYGITPYFNYYDITKIKVKLDGDWLKQGQVEQ